VVSCESSWPLLRGQRSFHLGNRGQDGNSQVGLGEEKWTHVHLCAGSRSAIGNRARDARRQDNTTRRRRLRFQLIKILVVIFALRSYRECAKGVYKLQGMICRGFPPQHFLFLFRTDYMDSSDFYCYFWAYQFLLFSFSVLHFLVVVSVR